MKEKTSTLKRYCAWHQKYFGTELFMGEIPSERDGVSHGICSECLKIVNKEIEEYNEKNKVQGL